MHIISKFVHRRETLNLFNISKIFVFLKLDHTVPRLPSCSEQSLVTLKVSPNGRLL